MNKQYCLIWNYLKYVFNSLLDKLVKQGAHILLTKHPSQTV